MTGVKILFENAFHSLQVRICLNEQCRFMSLGIIFKGNDTPKALKNAQNERDTLGCLDTLEQTRESVSVTLISL